MESQTRCNDTIGANIPNTLGKRAKKAIPAKYRLLDLRRLIFKLGDGERCDVETCTAEQFNTFASAVADVEDVDVTVWLLEVRRDFINNLWDFCVTEGFDFPLTEVADEAAQEGA